MQKLSASNMKSTAINGNRYSSNRILTLHQHHPSVCIPKRLIEHEQIINHRARRLAPDSMSFPELSIEESRYNQQFSRVSIESSGSLVELPLALRQAEAFNEVVPVDRRGAARD